MAYVWTMRMASGTTAVQIVFSSLRGSRRIEHLGSGHDEVEVKAQRAAARQPLAQGQTVLDLGFDGDGVDGVGGGAAGGGPARILASRAGHLWEALERAYAAVGLDGAVTGCAGARCWPGSGSPPRSWAACWCWRRSGPRWPRTRRLSGACPTTPRRPRGTSSPGRAPPYQQQLNLDPLAALGSTTCRNTLVARGPFAPGLGGMTTWRRTRRR